MKAENAKEFVEVWTEELNRTALLWNSLPENKMEGFREFLTEYKEFIGYATFHTYGKDAVIELLNGGLEPDTLGLTSRASLSAEEEGHDVMEIFDEKHSEELKKMIESKERHDRKKFGPEDPNKKSGVVQ